MWHSFFSLLHIEIIFSFNLAIKAKFEKLCKDYGLKFKFYLCGDDKPGHGICKLAKDEDAAAIIVGQRGLGTISRTLIGSTSDYVVHHANVPVIVVPKPQ